MSTPPVVIVRSRLVNPRLVNNNSAIQIDAEFKTDPQWSGKRLFGMNLRFLYDPGQFKYGPTNCRVLNMPNQWYIGTETMPSTIKPQMSPLKTWFNMPGGTVYVNSNIQGPLYEADAAQAGVPLLDNWARYFTLEIDLKTPLQPGQTIYPTLFFDKTAYGERGMLAGDGLTESLVINPASPDRQYVDEKENTPLNWQHRLPNPDNKIPFGSPTQTTAVTAQ